MNYLLIISFILVVFFSLLAVFPKYFLAKIGYKGQSHPDDYDLEDVKSFYYIFGVLMAGAWAFFICTVSGVI